MLCPNKNLIVVYGEKIAAEFSNFQSMFVKEGGIFNLLWNVLEKK